MSSTPSPRQAERFYASPCPVCDEPALGLDVAVHRLHFECGRCGSFDITIAAKSLMSRRSRQERETWLADARRGNSTKDTLALSGRTNEP